MGVIKYKNREYAGGGGRGASSEAIAPIEQTTTASKAYIIGDLLFYNNILYKVTSAIAQGGTITTSGASANVVQTDVDTELKNKQNTISDLSTIRSGATAGAIAYQKPQTGIPSTDLTSGVQTSLGKADTAIQSSDLATVATSGSYTDLDNKPTIPTVSVSYTGTASSTGVRKQQITVNGTDYDIFGTAYMEQDVLLSTSDVTIATFTNAAITTDSDIEVSVSDWSCVPENVSATTGTCAVTLPQVETAATVRVRIYIR